MRWLLKRLNIYPTAYYNYLKATKVAYLCNKQLIKNIITEIYHSHNGTPGHRMIMTLLKDYNCNISKTTVLKYTRELGLQSIILRKKPKYLKR